MKLILYLLSLEPSVQLYILVRCAGLMDQPKQLIYGFILLCVIDYGWFLLARGVCVFPTIVVLSCRKGGIVGGGVLVNLVLYTFDHI